MMNFVKNQILHKKIKIFPYKMFWGMKPHVDWLCIYEEKCWVPTLAAMRRKGQYKSIEGIFVGYYDNSKPYKIWIPRTHLLMKARGVIFDEI